MKKLLSILAILLVFCATSFAQAPSSPIKLYAQGGLTMPLSPDGFKDNVKSGYHFGAGVGFTLIPKVQGVAKAEYHMFGSDAPDSMGLGDLKILLLGADARVGLALPSAPISPFLIGGAGVANMSQDIDVGTVGAALSGTASVDETKFYVNVGGGVDLKSGPALTLFIQGRYVRIFTDDEAYAMFPITVGVRFL